MSGSSAAGPGTGVPKGGSEKRTAAEKRDYIRYHRPRGISVAEGCRLMGTARSTYYDRPEKRADDTAIVEAMFAICDEFEFYGYRRVGAALRQQGVVVNNKKIRRLMCEHGLQPKNRWRFIATTDSDHGGPIFPNLAQDIVPTGPNQLWVSDITYVALPTRFVYVAIVLDAWSRLIVGYAIGRSIDARLTVAALKAAIEQRMPPAGCIHHSDRGSPYAAEIYRQLLAANGLIGSMGRRGNPYDNAKAESFMKTLKVDAVYPWLSRPPRTLPDTSPLHRGGLQQTQAPFGAGISQPAAIRGSAHPADWQNSGLISVHPQGRTPARGAF
ncbi:IS3 family transposase [Mesorhizobium sp. WSM2239]|uniref:IS3 family transposase n=2 Tax=unclassified Mesorhizobium TaxID=325217 RepID=A0AAU8D7V8_9HYPH